MAAPQTESTVQGLDFHLDLYRRMVLIRRFEELVQSLFLRGEVYGYIVERVVFDDVGQEIDAKHIDSCWGFYGLDDVREQAQSMLDYEEKEAAERDLRRLSALNRARSKYHTNSDIVILDDAEINDTNDYTWVEARVRIEKIP